MTKKVKSNLQEEINEPVNKKIVALRIAGMIIFLSLLIMSTYAWFTSQRDITIKNLRGTVEVAENMEISLDAKLWYHKIDLSKLNESGDTPLQAAVKSRNAVYGGVPLTAPNIEPQQMIPLSTIGSEGIGKTYIPFYEGEAKTKKDTFLKDIKECDEYYENNANAPIDNGYFAFDMYIKNTSRTDDPDVLQLNLNSAVQVLKEELEKTVTYNGVTVTRVYKGEEFSGLQNTIRVALALYEDTVDSMANQKQILDVTKDSKISKVAIWEPNAPYHVQYIVDNNNKLTGPGALADGFKDGDKLVTYALSSAAVAGSKTIDNVYNTADSKLKPQYTLQTEIADYESEEKDYRIKSNEGKPIDLIEADVDETIFTIEANKVSRFRVYIWMEGQDIDCINLASFGGGVEVDLGLTKDNAVGNVLTEEDDDGLEPSEPGNS